MTVIPNFDLIKLIGEGAYGEVWLARDVNHLNTDRYRAVKIVRRGDAGQERPYEREYEGVEQYEPISREHEGLIDILQVGLRVDDGFFFYVMELADDCNTGQDIACDLYKPRTLQHDLETRGRLPFAECVDIAKALAEGLKFLHGKNLVHRDIKPANIISVNGKWKYGDTGLVTGADEDKTIVGTLGYLPPEGSGKAAADIFSLGKVFYQMCTGMDCQKFPDLPSGFDGIGDPIFKKLNSTYLKACEYNPELRYQNVSEMLDELGSSGQIDPSTANADLPIGTDAYIYILNEKGVEIDKYTLSAGEHFVGRKGHDNDVSIDDKSVSRKHAKLIVADGHVEIEDLKSTYGTSQDGRLVAGRIPIGPGQKIKVGRHYIQVAADESTEVSPVVGIHTFGEGRYKLLDKVGQGSFGEVWRMWDNELKEEISAKVLAGDFVDDFSVEDIKREVLKTRRLIHENIVRVFDFCSYVDDPPFLTMEYVNGQTLEAHRLAQPEQILTWEELEPLIKQLCDAVSYIHGKGVVHRDIKPANIILGPDGQIKLGDFGCARSMIISRLTMGENANQSGPAITGTLIYMSPQMLEGEEPAAADDIYAIGAMLYELLTGQTPFSWKQGAEELIEEIIKNNPPAPGKVLENRGVTNPIPDHVSALIMSCLSKVPEMRPAKAEMIMETFDFPHPASARFRSEANKDDDETNRP